MIWNLRDLVESTQSTTTEIKGKWVPSRPENWKYRSLRQKLLEAWSVFTGRAEAFVWPEGQ